MPKSLLEQLPKIVADGRQAERILERPADVREPRRAVERTGLR